MKEEKIKYLKDVIISIKDNDEHNQIDNIIRQFDKEIHNEWEVKGDRATNKYLPQPQINARKTIQCLRKSKTKITKKNTLG